MNETTQQTTAAAEAAATAAAGEAAATAQGAEVQPADAAQAPAQQDGGFFAGPFLMPLILIALFYFMFIKPQQRKEKERRKMIESMRAGAKVVFAGGILGTIVEAGERTFTVETKDGARMEILRSCVQGVAEEAPSAK